MIPCHSFLLGNESRKDVCDKFMRIHQNRSLDKFMQFLFMHCNILCIAMYGAINLCSTDLCNRHLTCVIYYMQRYSVSVIQVTMMSTRTD